MRADHFHRRAVAVTAAGLLVVALSIGVRQGFGLFLEPVSGARGWGRETFALAIALQNLVWGLSQPLTGFIADRYGSGRVLVAGGIGYAAGLYLLTLAGSPLALNLSFGFLMGLSLSATSFAVVLGAVGRAVPAGRRSLALGFAAAGGSVGQLVMLPATHGLMTALGWQGALGLLALVVLGIVPLALLLTGNAGGTVQAGPRQSPREAWGEARAHRGYWLLTAGFFVCGFQVTFISAHLPAYLSDRLVAPGVAALALGLIGGFNILGTMFWGYMGGRYSKRYALSAIYAVRGLLFAVFLALPAADWSVLAFAAILGFLWLGTVPLTSSLVGQIFGTQYLSTLFGGVYLGHQSGAFLGAWLGGWVFDAFGSYNPVWYVAIGLSVMATLLHWPIDESPVPRLAAEEA